MAMNMMSMLGGGFPGMGGCGCGGHHSDQEVRHAHSPEAEEMRAEGHQDLSEGRRNLGLRSAK